MENRTARAPKGSRVGPSARPTSRWLLRRTESTPSCQIRAGTRSCWKRVSSSRSEYSRPRTRRAKASCSTSRPTRATSARSVFATRSTSSSRLFSRTSTSSASGKTTRRSEAPTTSPSQAFYGSTGAFWPRGSTESVWPNGPTATALRRATRSSPGPAS